MKKSLKVIPLIVMVLLFATSINAQTATVTQLGASPGSVNLTTEGSLDWAFCGLENDANLLIRKNVDPLIVITPLHDNPNPDGDTGADIVWSDDEAYSNPFTWTDGTPTAAGTDVENGWWVAGEGNGFEITAPVSSTERVLIFYAGNWFSTMEMTVSIDGDNLATLQDSGREDDAADGNVDQYTITYSGTSGSVLKIEWILLENRDDAFGGWGNGPLRAVTLSEGSLSTDDSDGIIPSRYSLSQNYPNPFNPTTTFDFTLEAASVVNIAVYDVLGHKVRSLLGASMNPGTHSVTWDGRDENGYQLSAGTYFYRMTTGTYNLTKKMMLLK